VVAAAGPTLNDHYDWLQRERHRFTLIAVDAALQALVDAGIYPDVVFSIDVSLKGVLRFFQGFSLEPFRKSPLVYFPSIPAEVLSLWPGPRLTAYPDSDVYRELSKNYPKAILFSSGSVFHPAVDLAVRMGTDRIVLLGADFSFPDDLSHVKGSTAARKMSAGSHWIENGKGEQIATLPNLRGYLRDLETYISLHPEIQFINGSKRGAHINGARYMESLP
jgi:hypothetical protein